MSSRFPTGVGTTYSFPICFYKEKTTDSFNVVKTVPEKDTPFPLIGIDLFHSRAYTAGITATAFSRENTPEMCTASE